MVNEINSFNNQARTDSKSLRALDASAKSHATSETTNSFVDTTQSNINISRLSTLMGEFEDIAKAASGVHEAEVAELRSQIENNTYYVDAQNLAQKLLQSDS